MRKGVTSKPKNPPPQKPQRASVTMESTSYLGGLFREFSEQAARYSEMTGELLSLEARIELTEKTLCLHRDHLAASIQSTDGATPHDWDKTLRSVRFVGVRLADACRVLLQEHRKLTPQQLLGGLNSGMYRFRTNSPFREIHAALMKQAFAKKNGKSYVWAAITEDQIPLRLRVVNWKTASEVEAKRRLLDAVKVERAK